MKPFIKKARHLSMSSLLQNARCLLYSDYVSIVVPPVFTVSALRMVSPVDPPRLEMLPRSVASAFAMVSPARPTRFRNGSCSMSIAFHKVSHAFLALVCPSCFHSVFHCMLEHLYSTAGCYSAY
jgi:hypothetical protein